MSIYADRLCEPADLWRFSFFSALIVYKYIRTCECENILKCLDSIIIKKR